jgi:hypothetical protein
VRPAADPDLAQREGLAPADLLATGRAANRDGLQIAAGAIRHHPHIRNVFAALGQQWHGVRKGSERGHVAPGTGPIEERTQEAQIHGLLLRFGREIR